MATTKLFTAEDLATMGADAPFELDMGELVEVCPSFGDASAYAVNIIIPLGTFVKRGRLGVVFGPDGGFFLTWNPDTVRAPDVAFVRRERIPPGLDLRAFFPGAPDLAVEVLSSSNTRREIERKIHHYLAAGTTLIWIANPLRQTVEVVRPDQDRRLLQTGDVLDGQEVVPGFRLPVADIFDVFS
ncbi:MAG: Uma2 family endonuclease [Thermomicrobiales bacterium]